MPVCTQFPAVCCLYNFVTAKEQLSTAGNSYSYKAIVTPLQKGLDMEDGDADK